MPGRNSAARNRSSSRSGRIVLAALSAALLALTAAPSAQAAGMVGETASNFNLQASTGEFYELANFSNHVVFLFMVGYG